MDHGPREGGTRRAWGELRRWRDWLHWYTHHQVTSKAIRLILYGHSLAIHLDSAQVSPSSSELVLRMASTTTREGALICFCTVQGWIAKIKMLVSFRGSNQSRQRGRRVYYHCTEPMLILLLPLVRVEVWAMSLENCRSYRKKPGSLSWNSFTFNIFVK